MTSIRPLEGKRVLILEDDYYLARDEKLLLEEAGVDVVGPFGTAFQPGGLADAGRLDGAVVDINLGRGARYDIAKALHIRGVPFVFVTGYDATAIPAEWSHVERVEKPIRKERFVAAVARLTGSDSGG